MYHSISECIRTYRNVSEPIRMYQNVSELIKTIMNISYKFSTINTSDQSTYLNIFNWDTKEDCRTVKTCERKNTSQNIDGSLGHFFRNGFNLLYQKSLRVDSSLTRDS